MSALFHRVPRGLLFRAVYFYRVRILLFSNFIFTLLIFRSDLKFFFKNWCLNNAPLYFLLMISWYSNCFNNTHITVLQSTGKEKTSRSRGRNTSSQKSASARIGDNYPASVWILSHPSYSSDLAHAYFALFPKLQSELIGKSSSDFPKLQHESLSHIYVLTRSSEGHWCCVTTRSANNDVIFT